MSINSFLLKRYSYRPGQIVPWWIGLYRFDAMRGETVFAPIPINLLLRAGFVAWMWLRKPFKDEFQWAVDTEEVEYLKQRVADLEWEKRGGHAGW